MAFSKRVGICDRKDCGHRGTLTEMPLKNGRVAAFCPKCLKEAIGISPTPRESKEGHYTPAIAAS